MYVRNVNVSQRSVIGFGLIGAIVVLLGLFAMQQMSQMRTETQRLSKV